MVSRNLCQAHLLEVGLKEIPGDHETLSIVRHVGLHGFFIHRSPYIGVVIPCVYSLSSVLLFKAQPTWEETYMNGSELDEPWFIGSFEPMLFIQLTNVHASFLPCGLGFSILQRLLPYDLCVVKAPAPPNTWQLPLHGTSL